MSEPTFDELFLQAQELWQQKYDSLSKDGLSDVSIGLLIGAKP